MTEKYQKTTFENGLRIVSEKIEGVKSVSVGIWIFAGSRMESKEQTGKSHLLEHMVFKGTTSRTAYEIATSLESLGGHLNAFTEKELACFYSLVLDENLPEAIDILADIVQNAKLDETDLQNEKLIVFEEIRNLEDTPEDFVQEAFIQTVFKNHSLGFSILGSYESVKGIKRADLVAYRNTYYTSNNMIVAAAGNLNHTHLVELIHTHFIDLRCGSFSPPAEPILLGNQAVKRISSSINQTHICTGTTALSYSDRRKFPLIIMNALLGGGMSSRLFQILREQRGLAYSVYSFLDFWSDTGLLGVYAGTAPQNTDKAMKLIENELILLSEKKIPQNELDRIKSQLTRNLILSLEDSTSRMNRLAKMEAYTNKYTSLNEVIELINAVSQEDVQSVAHDLLKNRKRYTTLLEPV